MSNLSLESISYIEIYVSNAFQAALFYKSIFGFDLVSYAGPETGEKGKISYFLRQGSINLLITSPINEQSFTLGNTVKDNSVQDIAFTTKSVSRVYEIARKKGAISILEPTEIDDGKVKILKATIGSFGNTVHSFIEREDPASYGLPFHKPLGCPLNKNSIHLKTLDHIAVAVGKGELKKWSAFYQKVFGFHIFHEEEVHTNESGMNSTVVSNESENIKFVLVEGASKSKKSQVENYIAYNGCSGVQHLALSSSDIIKTVNLLKNEGIEFLEIPQTYYDDLPHSLKNMLQNKLEIIKKLNILVDLEKDGYLMQIFTRPLQNLPTFFIEIVQRENSRGFGSNNIKALYKAVEQDQHKAMIDDY